jgi:hypothetical protein
MIIPADEAIAVGVQFLEEQIRSNLTYVQQNPSAVILALLQSMQAIAPPDEVLIASSESLVHSNCTTNLRGLKDSMMKESTSSSDFIMNTGLSLMCVIFAGLASGLTQVSLCYGWYVLCAILLTYSHS